MAAVNGTIDNVVTRSSGVILSGWACDVGDNEPIQVTVYLGGPNTGGGKKIKTVLANVAAAPAVAKACATNSAEHRFHILLSNSEVNTYSGKTIFVYGVASTGNRREFPLNNSGKFTVPTGGNNSAGENKKANDTSGITIREDKNAVKADDGAEFQAPRRGPVVKVSNPNIVTQKLRAGSVEIGVSDMGGGYVNYFNIPGLGNVVSANYGRGWQGSIRDQLHSGRYNPTQAGFTDTAGAPVRVIQQKDQIIIPAFQMPLFGDPVFDFTEHEDLAPEAGDYNDGGSRDKDGINEAGKTQDDELRSEFDYEGSYKDASDLTAKYNVSTIQHYYRNTYVRNPGAILQFGPAAILEDGGKVYKPEFIVDDVSKLLPGNQTPGKVDLSKIIFTAYGARLKTSAGFNTAMWVENGQWQTLDKSKFFGRGNEKTFQIKNPNEKRNEKFPLLDNNLLILARGANPNSSMAIGIYAPDNSINTLQTLGRDIKTGDVKYSEDRRTLSTMMFSVVIEEQIDIRTRYYLTGLMAPNRAKQGIVEGVQHETYILYGTPANILKAINELKD